MLAAVETVTKADPVWASRRHNSDVAAKATAGESVHAASPPKSSSRNVYNEPCRAARRQRILVETASGVQRERPELQRAPSDCRRLNWGYRGEGVRRPRTAADIRLTVAPCPAPGSLPPRVDLRAGKPTFRRCRRLRPRLRTCFRRDADRHSRPQAAIRAPALLQVDRFTILKNN
jgi:hypothetical protein